MPRRTLAVIISCTVLLTAALLLASCGPESALTPTTTTTTEFFTMTTSEALGIAVSEGTDVVAQLGDAAISYLSGEGDLDTVQAPVAPSARDGLAQMLSLLNQSTRCKVMEMASFGSSNETQADLLFAGGTSEPAHFAVTILVDPDRRTITITAIKPGLIVDPFAPTSTTVTTIVDEIAAGSSLPVIQVQAKPKLDYMSYPYSYFTPEAVALATVVEVLPLCRNPLAGSGDPDAQNEHQPIVYKGYVLQVEKAYGPDTIPKRITVYALGNGTVALDGTTYEVREEFPLDASPGDRLSVPLVKIAYFGTPELKPDEYWV